MMSTPSGILSRFLTTGLLCTWLCACGGPAEGPEDALRSWVRQGQAFAEAKDRRALVEMISPTYTDARGNRRDDLENLFRIYFLRQNKVALIAHIEELTVYDGSAAELVLTVGMAGTNSGTFGFSADAYRFEMEFEREDEDWLLTSARWAELGEAPH